MAEPTLTSYDHLLASAVTAVVAARVHDAKRETMWLEILRDTLPHVTRDHPRVADLAIAAEQLVDFSGGGRRCWAHMTASAAVVKWSEWRIGRAQNVIENARAAA